MLHGLHRAANFRLNPIFFLRGEGQVTPIFFLHISSSWVKISLHTEFQLPRLPLSRNASFRLNPILKKIKKGGGVGWSGDPNFSIHMSYSRVKISLHTEFQLPRLAGSRNASFRLNPILFIFFGGGLGDPIFWFIFLLVGLK